MFGFCSRQVAVSFILNKGPVQWNSAWRALDKADQAPYLSFMGKFFAILLSLAFIAVQTVTMAHASAYGDEPHTHDGVECIVAKAGDRTDGGLDVPKMTAVIHLPRVEAAVADFSATALLIPTVTASPPGRAPPHA